MDKARRIALLGMIVSGLLAVLKISVGLLAYSTSVLADGFESAADVFASAPLTLTIALFIALAVRLESRGGALYGHARVGLGAREFRALKFRSMVSTGDQVLEQRAVEGCAIVVGQLDQSGFLDEPAQLDQVTGAFAALHDPATPIGPRRQRFQPPRRRRRSLQRRRQRLPEQQPGLQA